MRKILVSKRTEAAFKKAYGYPNKSVQTYINAIIKGNDEMRQELNYFFSNQKGDE